MLLATPPIDEQVGDVDETRPLDRGRPLAVAGMHRSGTSMVIRLLRECGLWIGTDRDLLPPAPDNPEGFWEHRQIVNIDDELLQAFGGAWDAPPRFTPNWVDDPRAAALRAAAADALASLACDSAWGFKDPRLCLTMPFWSRVVPTLRVVICLRNPLEVAASLRERNGSSYSFGVSLWARYMLDLLDGTDPATRLVTHFDAYFGDPEGEVARIAGFAGLVAGHATIESAVLARRKESRHSRFGWQDLGAAGLDQRLVDLYDELCEEACWYDDADHRAAARTRTSPHVQRERAAEPGGSRLAVSHGALEPSVVDYRLLHWRYIRRGGHIAGLEQRIGELERQLREVESELAASRRDSEALRHRALGLDFSLLDGMSSIANRLDSIEATVHRSLPVGEAGPPAWFTEALLVATPPSAKVVVGIREEVPPSWMGRQLAALPAAAVSGDRRNQLQALRANGAEYLLLSAVAREEASLVGDTLAGRYRLVETEGGSVTADLRQDLDLTAGLGALVAAFEIVTARTPTVLAWGCKLDAVAPSFEHASSPASERLDHVDRSFDLVVIPSGRPDLLGEAARVAGFAVAEIELATDPPRVREVARRFGPATRPVVTLVVTGLASAAAPLALLHTCFEGTVGADVDLVVSSDLERTLADRIDAEFGIRRTVSFPGTSLAGLVALTGSDIVVGLEATAVPVGPWLSRVVRTFEQHQADVVCSRFVAFDGTLRSAGGESRGDATTAIGMGEDPEAEPFRRVRVVDAAAGPVTAVHGRRLDPTTHPKVVYQPEWVVVALDGAPQFPARPH